MDKFLVKFFLEYVVSTLRKIFPSNFSHINQNWWEEKGRKNLEAAKLTSHKLKLAGKEREGWKEEPIFL